MGLLSRITSAWGALTGVQANSITTSQELSRVLRADPTSSGASVTSQTAMQTTAVYAAVRAVTDAQAMLPLAIFRRTPEGAALATTLKVYDLLHDRPNEWQTAFEWRELKQRDIELEGNAYSLIVRGLRGEPVELIRLHPRQVRVEQDVNTMAVSYRYTRKDGREITLSRRDVFHVRGMGDDGLVGRSPIADHRETIGEAMAQRNHMTAFLGRGAKPLGVLTIEDGRDMGIEDRAALREDWESLYAGPSNAYRTAILPDGVKYQQVSISAKDAQYIEVRKFSRSEIASIFRVPPHMIGDLERATFTNIEHQALEFVTYSLMPRLVRWEQAIARDLLPPGGEVYAKFNVSALLRGDAKSRSEALQIQRRNGIISANEWRALEELNRRPDEGGDRYIIEANMAADQPGAVAPPPDNGGAQS